MSPAILLIASKLLFEAFQFPPAGFLPVATGDSKLKPAQGCEVHVALITNTLVDRFCSVAQGEFDR